MTLCPRVARVRRCIAAAAVAIAGVASAGPAWAQTIGQLARNTYVSTQGLTRDEIPRGCSVSGVSFERRLTILSGEGDRAKARLVITRSGSTSFSGGIPELRRDPATGRVVMVPVDPRPQRRCDAIGRDLRTEIEMTFSDGDFTSTVLRSTESEIVGNEDSGDFTILDSGRSIALSYSDGTRRVYHASGAFQVTPVKAPPAPAPRVPSPGEVVTAPSRAPDLVLVCRPISSREGSSSATSSSGYNSPSGSTSSGSTSSTMQCRDSNWQARRETFQIWLNEKVCGSAACLVTEQEFNIGWTRINRYTGQMIDACFVWECAPGSVQRRF